MGKRGIFCYIAVNHKTILMPDDQVKIARQAFRNKFGEAFEKKATDAFVLTYFKQSQRETAVIREAGKPAVKTSVILEFDEKKPKEVTAESAMLPADKDSRIREAIANIPEPDKQVRAALHQYLRNAKIKSYKEKSLMQVQSIHAELDKKSTGTVTRESMSAVNQPLATEYCWLNRTMKTNSDNNVLAEAVQDNQITAVDLPRLLVREVTKTVPGIFASQYVQKFARNGKNISVAIIDSEVFFDHPALKGRVVKMENYTTEPWGNPDFHGTAIAGIIGSDGTVDITGTKNNAFLGIAPGVMMHNYKVLATKSNVNADDFGGTKAIERAVEDGMHIANCSWGIDKIKSTISREAKACNTAWDLGLVIVKSAGNNGSGASTLTTPAEADGVIVVGACGKNAQAVENYSSRGPIPSNAVRPHLIAPGGSPSDNMLSCLTTGGFGPAGYGTSYAAPHVSGLLALILEENPDLSNDELRDFAIRLCTVLQNIKPEIQGNGIISLRSLVE